MVAMAATVYVQVLQPLCVGLPQMLHTYRGEVCGFSLDLYS